MSTESYPLRWPDGWQKTAAVARSKGGQFSVKSSTDQLYNKVFITFSRARKSLIEELERLGATYIQITSSVDIRADGIPRPHVDPDKVNWQEPGVAIYFMLKGRAMTMAQDAFSTPAANMRSLALAVDALRSLERHGGGAMMARAFEGFAALAPPAGMKPKRPWWTVLRYSENPEDRELLSAGEVEARFKTLAKKYHPDAGGSSEEMSELNAAREEAIAELAQ